MSVHLDTKINGCKIPPVSINLLDTTRTVSFQSTRHGSLTSSILVLAVTKRKPTPFSATKAVKANARERVGQPKPSRVLSTEPRTGRAAKHKPKLEEIIRQED